METERTISLTLNGTAYTRRVPVRALLSEFIRDDLGLTGTHVGCEQGVCGACTITFDGQTTRSCLMLAVQADGAEITTVEGLSKEGELHPVQQAFWEEHGVQCGFCTAGILLTVRELLSETHAPSEEAIRLALAGNICRCTVVSRDTTGCTGYQNIVKAVIAADRLWER